MIIARRIIALATVAAAASAALLGCAGDARSFDRDPVGPRDAVVLSDSSGGRVDGGGAKPDAPGDSAAPAGDGAGGSNCSSSGIKASCDPVALSGCAKGQCYVVPGAGAACVCPSGSIATGQPCNTTIACAPGHVCAGTQAPGTCRRTCNPAAPSCAAGLTCTPVTAFPQFGFCEPPRDGGP